MRSLKATLNHIAKTHSGFARRLYASLAKEAGKKEDAFARASFIEGLTGRTPGSLANQADRSLSQLFNDLVTETDNRIIEHLRFNKKVSERDLKKLLGATDLKLFEALKAGAASGMGSGGVRGLDPEDVAMAIAMGLSPLTLEPLRYGKGKNVFYHLGKSSGNKVTIGGLASILKAEGKNRAIDIIRGAPKGELEALDLYSPVVNTESNESAPMMIGDMIEAPTQYRSHYVDLLDAIFSDNAIISQIDREIYPKLKGDVQRAVWGAIKANPDLLNLRGGRVVVRNKELAEALGGGASPQAAGKVFNQKVWPAIEDALTTGAMTQRLIKKRQILEIIQEAQKDRGRDKSRTRGIEISGLPETPRKGPVKRVHGPFRLELPLQGPQPQGVYDSKGRPQPRMPKYSARRVVAKYLDYVEDREGFEKSAWRLPPGDARVYKKMKDWARDNWEQFQDARGKINFDKFADTLAGRFGKSSMADEPEHWVWEIVYDVGRLRPTY